jgi:hypothetical protein
MLPPVTTRDDPITGPTSQVSLPADDFEPYAQAVITITNLAAAVRDAANAVELGRWAGADQIDSVLHFLAALPQPVSVKFAAERLSLSQPALREWIRRELIRTEHDRLGRVRIPFAELVALSQRVARLRAANPNARLLPLIDAELETEQVRESTDVLRALRAVSDPRTPITIQQDVSPDRRRDIEASVARRRARLHEQLAREEPASREPTPERDR